VHPVKVASHLSRDYGGFHQSVMFSATSGKVVNGQEDEQIDKRGLSAL
jgi:hypothetical protein